MHSIVRLSAVWAAAFLSLTAAQSYTSCDPTEKTTCSEDEGTTSSDISYDFTQSADLEKWTTTAGTVTASESGAEFTISEEGDAPTIETDYYIFFGEVSITMQGAPGTGIVSSAILESDDLDEIDWVSQKFPHHTRCKVPRRTVLTLRFTTQEILGAYSSKLQTDYYGKGDSGSYDRWTWVDATDPLSTFHTYKWVWTETEMTWAIDGSVVRTVTYDEAVHDGESRYPQTPMRVRLGIWAGGSSSSSGTVEWAGGETDYADGPFTMYVKSVSIVNYNPAEYYKYTDESGSMDSIEIIGGTGTSGDASSTGYYLSSTGSSSGSHTAPASVAAASGTLWRSHPSLGTQTATPTLAVGGVSFLSLIAILMVMILL
ncbi:concanavalin A-like lectin/glucanase [Penicillium malachiteum]|uniref:concanavalin A-like lectin/glucanase n=1 Tax=Penicillium malachiteum TaxID=1324776 RepID=UPI002549B30B|nr:concanavalin A-like lectin/glucanase [Penicillium malachiteum]KAJ5715279.1 concanavalin A-like lectin/glucanase [Penicillium malachiteum]